MNVRTGEAAARRFTPVEHFGKSALSGGARSGVEKPGKRGRPHSRTPLGGS